MFTAPYLQAGTYTIAVTLSGFAQFKRAGVVVGATETVRVPVELTMSQLGETVEVSAEAPLLQTDRTSVSGAIGAEMIEALPNITQNPLAYAFLQAGAIPRVSAQSTDNANAFGIGVDGRRQWSAVGINGGRAFTNDIQLDGLPVMGGGYNEAAVVPNTEGLQEVRVISNNFSAEYGRGQAVIAMSTKSGTNASTATAAYMVRDERLDANSFSEQRPEHSKARVPRSATPAVRSVARSSATGCSSSAAITACGTTNTSTALMTVPTALERVGNFSQSRKPRRERESDPGRASSTRSTSCSKGPTSIAGPKSRTRLSRTRIRLRSGCSATTRCRTGRRTTSTTRTTSSRRQR